MLSQPAEHVIIHSHDSGVRGRPLPNVELAVGTRAYLVVLTITKTRKSRHNILHFVPHQDRNFSSVRNVELPSVPEQVCYRAVQLIGHNLDPAILFYTHHSGWCRDVSTDISRLRDVHRAAVIKLDAR